jgi:predicted XRE-type DNA-binding protein
MAGVPPVFTITLASPNTKFPNQIPQLLLQAYPALTLDIHAGASQLPNASKDADEAYIALSHRREIPAAIIEYTKGHSLALRTEYTATLCTVGGNQTLAERVQATLLGQDQLLGVQNQIAQVLQVQQQILDELQRQRGQITQSLALQVKLSAQGMNTRIHRLNRLVLEGVSLIPCYPLKEVRSTCLMLDSHANSLLPD